MAASPSVSQKPGRDEGKDPQRCPARHILTTNPPASLHSDARQIIISPGSISTDRRATSSSSSDKGLWFADRPENSFQLREVESLGGERERQLRGIRSGWVSRSTKSKEAKAYQLNQACSRGSTNCVQIQRAAGIKTDTQSQQQLTMRAMNRPKSCTAGIWVSGEQSAV